MNQKIVVSLFDRFENATDVVSRLEQTGIRSTDISLIDPNSTRSRYWDSTAGSDTAATGRPGDHTGGGGYAAAPAPGIATGSASPILPVKGVEAERPAPTSADADRAAADLVYGISEWLVSEGVDEDGARAYAEGVRRGGTLLAVRCDESDLQRVVEIVDGAGVLDIDERQIAWREEGWRGGERASTGHAQAGGKEAKRDEVIPVAEEELHVGKRQVSHGRVRIHSPVSNDRRKNR